MNWYVLPAVLAIAFSATAAAPEQGQLDGNLTLFTVMAAMNAAGYYADSSSTNNSPLRDQVRLEVERRNPTCLAELKDFFESHRKRTDTAELAQYVSFALTVKGPPDFAFTQRDVDIPPDVVPLKNLSALLTRFYKEARVEDLWQRSQPAINQYIARLHDPLSTALLQVSSYLRHVDSSLDRSHFQIAVELLAAPNQVQARSYGYEFTVVVTPAPEPRVFDVRHEYMHYLLDPLSTGQREVLDRKKVIADHAMRAPALDDSFKEDFLLLTTESLIKAIEARLDHKPENVDRALHQGYILTPFFAEQLPAYEKQQLAMDVYFADMVKAIDLKKEEERLVNVVFDERPAASAVVKAPVPPPPPPATGAAKTLEEAERLYEARLTDAANLDKAKALYLEALQQTDRPVLHAASYYGLARIAALQRDPDTAEQLFQKALESQPEPQVKTWALVYLGKLSLAAGDRDQAVKDFQEALKVDGASETARKAATEALQNIPKQ